MQIRAAIYARISETSEKRNKVADQVDQCRALAVKRGYEVIDREPFTDDGISAMGAKVRPGFEALLDAILAREFDIVLATEEERFARNVKEKAELQAACIESGVVWETIRDGHVDPTSESGEFFSTIRAAMGRMESRRKAARQKAANDLKVSEGRPLPGRRRYGYDSDGINPRRIEDAVVVRMFKHILDGGSIRSLAVALTAEKVDPAPGVEWSPRRVRDIITNPHYAARLRHLGTVTGSDVIVAIVDEKTFDTANALLADPGRKVSPGNQRRHFLSGLVVCGECGNKLVFRNSYICGDHPGHVSMKKALLEEHVRDEIAKALLTGGAALFAGEKGEKITNLLVAYARNREAVSVATADRDEGLVPADMARTRLIELRNAREQIEVDLDRARHEKGAGAALLAIASKLLAEPAEDGIDFTLAKLPVLAEFDRLALDQKRGVVSALLWVQLPKGRDPRRAVILHRLATHLNPIPLDQDDDVPIVRRDYEGKLSASTTCTVP